MIDLWDQNCWSSLSHLTSKEPVPQAQDLVVNELVASQLGQCLFEILNGLFVAVEQRTRASPPHGGDVPASESLLKLL